MACSQQKKKKIELNLTGSLVLYNDGNETLRT